VHFPGTHRPTLPLKRLASQIGSASAAGSLIVIESAWWQTELVELQAGFSDAGPEPAQPQEAVPAGEARVAGREESLR
jgi:hypothetical protein